MSPFLDWAGLLGRRTAELHVALATGKRIPAFVPEPMNGSLAKLVKALLGQTTETLSAIRKARGTLPAEVRPAVDRLLAGEGSIRKRFEDFGHRPLSARMCRIHGDYHLGQVLFTGRDFLIIDFEGEPARSLEERRRKHSPLRDVAGMLRSFHYAACVGLGPGHAELARHWCDWMCVAFLREYREFGGCIGLPRNDRDFRLLLDVYLMEKALYELRYELNNRPDWVQVPLAGILNLMEEDIS